MTLGGFALALGVLVDDAIIDIENIARRLRLAGPNADRLKVIEDASVEIRGSMLYGTLAVIFAFFPVLFAGGVQGQFIRTHGLDVHHRGACVDARRIDCYARVMRTISDEERGHRRSRPS